MSNFKKWISEEEPPEEMLEALILYLAPALSEIKDKITQSLFVEQPTTAAAPEPSKKKNSSFIEDSNLLYNNILLFQQAIQQLQG